MAQDQGLQDYFMTTTWMVRAGRNGDSLKDFVSRSLVAMGSTVLGEISSETSKPDLIAHFTSKYPDLRTGTQNARARQFARFILEVRVHDGVVTYDRVGRIYLIGTVISPWEWAPGLVSDKPYIRHVVWTGQVGRDSLRVATKNTLGAIQTLFKLGKEATLDLNENKSALPSPCATETWATVSSRTRKG
jgi:restriction system protein